MTDIEKFNADCDAIEAHMDARQAEIAKLRGFAQRVFEEALRGTLDTAALERAAVEFGLLSLLERKV